MEGFCLAGKGCWYTLLGQQQRLRDNNNIMAHGGGGGGRPVYLIPPINLIIFNCCFTYPCSDKMHDLDVLFAIEKIRIMLYVH